MADDTGEVSTAASAILASVPPTHSFATSFYTKDSNFGYDEATAPHRPWDDAANSLVL